MKKIIVFLILIMTVNVFAVTVKGSGKAVITNDDLKTAEVDARKSALIDALYNYFNQNYSKKDFPDINEEFFKFIKGYKILSREIKDYTVYYNVEVDVDDIAIGDATYFINNVTESVVYSIDNTDLNPDLKNSLKKFLYETLPTYNFSVKYQEDYDIETPDEFEFQDKLANFGTSKAKFYFVFKLTPEVSMIDNEYLCRLTLVLKIFTKKEAYPSIKTVTSALAKDESSAMKDAFKKASLNVIKYVRNNLIKLPENSIQEHNFTFTFLNFGKFSNINKMLGFLKEKGFIEKYTLKAYSTTEATFEIITKFSIKKLSEKAISYNNRLIIETEDDELIITFL